MPFRFDPLQEGIDRETTHVSRRPRQSRAALAAGPYPVDQARGWRIPAILIACLT